MSKKSKNGKARELSQPRGVKPISFEAAIFIFGLLNMSANQAAVEHALKLALRDSDLRDTLRTWLPSLGENIDTLIAGEPTDMPSKAAIRAFAEPFLNTGAGVVAYAQMADIYLFRNERTPENIMYAFYNGTRFIIAGEREPTDEEKKRIWKIALWLAQTSKIGAPHWKELESKGPIYLREWIDKRKDDARKKYKTFLSQMKRAQAATNNALASLMSNMFGDEETP